MMEAARGRYSYKYRFSPTAQPTAYTFRALLPWDGTRHGAATASNSVRVSVE
jgi:hypothetical protein